MTACRKADKIARQWRFLRAEARRQAAQVKPGDKRAKRRAKIERRKAEEAERKARREARPPAVQPTPRHRRRLADDPAALLASIAFVCRKAAASRKGN